MTGRVPARIVTIFTPVPRQYVLRRYSIAICAAAVAILLRWLLDPVLGHVAFYVTLYIAVAFCAIVCGYAPAILCGILGFLGIFYWFVDPRHSLQLIRQPQVHSLVGAFLVCAVLTFLGATNRGKQLLLNETIEALTTEGRERRRAQDELRTAHDQLEERVQHRTRELSTALARLESEIAVREQTEDQLRKLSLRLMTLQDQERRRIARELHDTAGQTLAAMKMSIALIRQADTANPRLQPLIDDLNALVDGALQEVRTASYLLHPPLLDEAGFASAARWFVEGFATRSGIQVQCDIPEKFERPGRDRELVLFRILQESLTNVHRHSEATTATVRLARHNGMVQLEIADNGKGIPEERLRHLNTSADKAGVGITGMRERVRELGGTLEIRSLSRGTSVSAVLPLSQSDAGSHPNRERAVGLETARFMEHGAGRET
jgi:signal transduction histidine kinase